ncbi:MAG: ABC transporter ATP-binding protein, partial [Betaproteobacteria bacterium]|nr:ABC transporter ATP-binding protein [Betaproteobacteria bacterium]
SLLLALAGLRAPRGGTIQLAGRPLAGVPRRERARQLGVLLQDGDPEFWGSTLEFVLLGRYPHSGGALANDAVELARALALIDELDLATHADQAYHTLSGGERQRARLAQLFVQDPAVLLLDEPLSHLDLKHQQIAMAALARRAAQGAAIIMAMHEPQWAARHCDSVVLMYDFRHAEQGDAETQLTLENLERLYDCELDATQVPAARPAPAGKSAHQSFRGNVD